MVYLSLKRHFLQKDRLGSTTQIRDESGAIVHTKGYDAFGKPRNGDTWGNQGYGPKLNFEDDPNYPMTTDITKRGFTDHEHLDAFELIHMNGRMYDFNNGRFLSVDPVVQGVDSQAINPYSYIHNNPLSGTDPTGYAICDKGSEESCNKQRRSRGNFINSRSNFPSGQFRNGIRSLTFTLNKDGTIAEIESESRTGQRRKHEGVTFLSDGSLRFLNQTDKLVLFQIRKLKWKSNVTNDLDRAKTSSNNWISSIDENSINSGTHKLDDNCRKGITSACTELYAVNETHLEIAIGFIRLHDSWLIDRFWWNPVIIEFDYTDEFRDDDVHGRTNFYTGNIRLAPMYNSLGALVNTVAHELYHSAIGVYKRAITNIQDKESTNPRGGDLHQKAWSVGDLVEEKFDMFTKVIFKNEKK